MEKNSIVYLTYRANGEDVQNMINRANRKELYQYLDEIEQAEKEAQHRLNLLKTAKGWILKKL